MAQAQRQLASIDVVDPKLYQDDQLAAVRAAAPRRSVHSIVIASEAKQSIVRQVEISICFVAEPVIGPAQAGRTRWLLAMTTDKEQE